MLVIPNLSHFTREGDNGADALCRRASHHRWYLSQSLDVRDFRVQVVSDTTGGFENDSYHLSC